MIKGLRVMKLYKNHSHQILMKRKQPVKRKNFYILLASLLTTIALSIAVSINCYLIKYQAE